MDAGQNNSENFIEEKHDQQLDQEWAGVESLLDGSDKEIIEETKGNSASIASQSSSALLEEVR